MRCAASLPAQLVLIHRIRGHLGNQSAANTMPCHSRRHAPIPAQIFWQSSHTAGMMFFSHPRSSRRQFGCSNPRSNPSFAGRRWRLLLYASCTKSQFARGDTLSCACQLRILAAQISQRGVNSSQFVKLDSVESSHHLILRHRRKIVDV